MTIELTETNRGAGIDLTDRETEKRHYKLAIRIGDSAADTPDGYCNAHDEELEEVELPTDHPLEAGGREWRLPERYFVTACDRCLDYHGQTGDRMADVVWLVETRWDRELCWPVFDAEPPLEPMDHVARLEDRIEALEKTVERYTDALEHADAEASRERQRAYARSQLEP